MLCIQTPPKQSAVDSKPICHLDPLLPRFIYVAWLFYSCSLLWDMVLNVRGLKECTSSEKWPFAALLGNSSLNNFVSSLYKDRQSCPWPLVEYMKSNVWNVCSLSPALNTLQLLCFRAMFYGHAGFATWARKLTRWRFQSSDLLLQCQPIKKLP